MIALFIILVAWLNHVNISSTLRLKLLKQNSIETVYGMEKKQQFLKILTETLSDFYSSFILAIVLIILFIPQINQMLERGIEVFSYKFLWFSFFIGLGLLSLITAFFESEVVSRVNFINAIKGQLGKNNSGKWIKKAVFVTQYAIAVILIFLTSVVFMQTRYLLNRDIGLEKENIFIVKGNTIINDERKQDFLNEIRKFPEIKTATFTNVVPGIKDAMYQTFLAGQSSDEAITNLFV
ncbi:MAG: hypothetical protein HQ541_08685 [Mariniphaga sp.]|nr:hypothetical protein [Mariniphaga sp.]